MFSVKATIDVPDDLYRQVKAKSALEGRAIREVTRSLFRLYVEGGPDVVVPRLEQGATSPGEDAVPSWFAPARRLLAHDVSHEWPVIEEAIGRGWAASSIAEPAAPAPKGQSASSRKVARRRRE